MAARPHERFGPCDELRPLLADDVLGLLDDVEQQSIDAHLDVCEPCREERRNVEAELAGLSELYPLHLYADADGRPGPALDAGLLPGMGPGLDADARARLGSRVERLVEAEIERQRDAIFEQVARTLRDGSTFLAQRHGPWVSLCAGVRGMVLDLDAKADRRTLLVQMDAGSRIPAHAHHADEETSVLHGDLRHEDVVLEAGDSQRVPAGVTHAEQWSREGCLALVTGSLLDVLEPLHGPR